MADEQQAGEAPKPMRILCMKCMHWVETTSDGPKYLYMAGCGVLPPASAESIKARALSAKFMRKHMIGCRGFVRAIYESDPIWAALDNALALRESESDVS